ncbi:polyol transporter 5-like [Mercurialis annua]|uniref:polyol transporter 5-like n=1 Tax=Mercurialis annua TaxID=3986 RepID=UPI0024ADCC88|nr:polyol transporter 5-like [Mercurialis annua]
MAVPRFYAIICAALASSLFFIFAFDQVMLISNSDYLLARLNIKNVYNIDFVVITTSFEVAGSLAAGLLLDWRGRRLVVILSGVMSFIGVLVMFMSNSYTVLVFSRIAIGTGIGMGYLSIPIYIAELSPLSVRGVLASFPEVLFNIGFLLGSVLDLKMSVVSERLTLLIFVIISATSSFVITIVLSVLIPESPSWLMRRGRIAEATRTIIRCTGETEEANERINIMRLILGVLAGDSRDVVDDIPREVRGRGFLWMELFYPTPTIAGVILSVNIIQVIQQLTAIDSLISIGTPFFVYANIIADEQALIGLICAMCFRTIALLAPMLMLDKYGRVRLLMISIAGTVISLGLLGVLYFSIYSSHKFVGGQNIFAIFCIFTLAGSFSLGLGPIPYIYNAEAFPYGLRSQGTSFAVAIHRLVRYFMHISSLTIYRWLPFGIVLLLQTIVMFFLMFLGLNNIRETNQELAIILNLIHIMTRHSVIGVILLRWKLFMAVTSAYYDLVYQIEKKMQLPTYD